MRLLPVGDRLEKDPDLLFGNAVPVNLAFATANEIRKSLEVLQ